MERWRTAVRDADVEGLEALVGEPFVFDERRALMRTIGDREMYLASVATSFDAHLRVEAEIVSTLGDRLSLELLRWSGTTVGGDFEGETLNVEEVNNLGRLIAIVSFDLEDRLAAHDELWRRFRETEDGSVLPSVVFDIVHAYNHRDVERFRTYLAPDFELVDHRPLGAGRMGPDDYVAFLAALLESTVESRFESVRSVRLDPRGSIDVARLTGTTIDGAPFELDALQVTVVRDGKLAHWEMFPLDGVDAAQARFEQLMAQ